MTQPIGVGILGMGWMGQVHSRAYQAMQDRFHQSSLDVRLVACADDVKARAEQGVQRFGFSRCTTDWRDVVADPSIQLISVTAPNHLHYEMVLAACRKGKHVFCEKPVGRSADETADIEFAARRAGVVSGVGFNYRWAPLVQYVKQLVTGGELGDITHYRGRFFVGYGSNPDSVLSWRFQEPLAGSGTLGDLMSHAVDMALYIAGPVSRLTSTQETFITDRPLAPEGEGTHFSVAQGGPRGAVTNEDYVSTLMSFANGARGVLEACRVINGPVCEMAWEVYGTKGAARWSFERMNELELFRTGSSAEHGWTRIMAGPDHPFFSQFYPGSGNSMGYEDLKLIEAFQFLQAVRSATPAEPSFQDVLSVAEVLSTITRSWQSERWESVTSLRKEN